MTRRESIAASEFAQACDIAKENNAKLCAHGSRMYSLTRSGQIAWFQPERDGEFLAAWVQRLLGGGNGK